MELFLPIVLTARFLSNHYCSIGKNAAVFLGGIPASAFKLIRILFLRSNARMKSRSSLKLHRCKYTRLG